MKETAIVTGGAGGIGRAIVRGLLARNINTAIVDVDKSGEMFALACCEEFGADCARFYKVDIADVHQVTEVVKKLEQSWGNVTYLVNNAVYSVYEPFLEITPASWAKVMDVGLTGSFYFAQAFSRVLVEEGREGRIVNVASINSFAVEHGVAHYASVKGALVQLTKSLALELGAHGIIVNAVAPGMTETDKNREIFNTEPFVTLKKRIPLGRTGTPEEITNVILFLLLTEHYMTGQTLLADGGLLSGI
ncbi:hypothetical protein SY83_13445 [Paenibacillus swuensis]|uniref:Short-chain dehydrogenase n=1 Tax=Paenibacillus swuensis TaxID=1178515 RepID=A0A172TJ87_9BACL|nr:SDR family oxidoreductase [Paenibacillus swuensis]ANE47098.1 hypothetical protein SY83_13445 [Paenibacillus swuensis]